MPLTTEAISVRGFERVVFGEDRSVGLQAIISIHNISLGPSCGGIRLLPYGSRQEALNDVLRLSKGMSYKSALANVGFGGGKSVIILDPGKKDSALLEAFGTFVETLGGHYIAAKDMNIEAPDLLAVKRKTRHVLGIEGIKGSSGDPSPLTAKGLFRALEATSEFLWGTRQVDGLTVLIQGVGHVGSTYARFLSQAGAKIILADVEPHRVKRLVDEIGATSVDLGSVFDTPCDVFSPCAQGGVLNEKSIASLKCRAVVGAANNQLSEEEDAYRLVRRGILYAPDFAINSGGIINIFVEYQGKYSAERAAKMTDNIFVTLGDIFKQSRSEGVPPTVIAERIAEERMGIRTKLR